MPSISHAKGCFSHVPGPPSRQRKAIGPLAGRTSSERPVWVAGSRRFPRRHEPLCAGLTHGRDRLHMDSNDVARRTATRLRGRHWDTVIVTVQTLQLLLPDGLSASAVADTLAGEIPIVSTKAHTIERTFWDTFDGRVHGSGMALVGAAGRLALLDAATYGEHAGELLRRATTRLLAVDLPAGALREQLEPLIEMRAVLPVVRVKSRQLPLNVLDDIGKIVVRLRVEEPTALGRRRGRGRRAATAPARHRRARLRPRARARARAARRQARHQRVAAAGAGRRRRGRPAGASAGPRRRCASSSIRTSAPTPPR